MEDDEDDYVSELDELLAQINMELEKEEETLNAEYPLEEEKENTFNLNEMSLYEVYSILLEAEKQNKNDQKDDLNKDELLNTDKAPTMDEDNKKDTKKQDNTMKDEKQNNQEETQETENTDDTNNKDTTFNTDNNLADETDNATSQYSSKPEYTKAYKLELHDQFVECLCSAESISKLLDNYIKQIIGFNNSEKINSQYDILVAIKQKNDKLLSSAKLVLNNYFDYNPKSIEDLIKNMNTRLTLMTDLINDVLITITKEIKNIDKK